MGSNTHQSFQQPNSALLRFRSAPSSLLADFAQGIDSSKRSNLFDVSESERFVSRFGNRGGGGGAGGNSNDSESPAAGNYSSGLPPHYPRLSSAVNCSSSSSSSSTSCSSSSSSMSSSLGFLGSNLARQSSSPAGVFSQLNPNGYGGGAFSRLSGNNNGGEVSPSSNRLNSSQISFSSLLPSSLGMLSQISEQVGNEKLANANGEAHFFTPSGFPFASWNESSQFSEAFPSVKRDPNSNRKLFSSNHQNGETGNRVHLLSHHLSLPKNASDIASIDRLLQLQDAVPCRIRAKRGCATHPRSIAERVRRTRISERMRKLQELVPNMDKQTNTADMLDLAVDYIKELQKQFKTLSDNRAKCVCLNMQKPVSNQIM